VQSIVIKFFSNPWSCPICFHFNGRPLQWKTDNNDQDDWHALVRFQTWDRQTWNQKQ